MYPSVFRSDSKDILEFIIILLNAVENYIIVVNCVKH